LRKRVILFFLSCLLLGICTGTPSASIARMITDTRVVDDVIL